MQTNIYLRFNGTCEEAFKLYAAIGGGTIEMLQRFEDSPAQDQVPAELRKQVLHARLKLGDAVIMGSDAPPGRYQTPDGFSVSLTLDAPADAERLLELAAGRALPKALGQVSEWPESAHASSDAQRPLALTHGRRAA